MSVLPVDPVRVLTKIKNLLSVCRDNHRLFGAVCLKVFCSKGVQVYFSDGVRVRFDAPFFLPNN
jgi:hypothetical protein